MKQQILKTFRFSLATFSPLVFDGPCLALYEGRVDNSQNCVISSEARNLE